MSNNFYVGQKVVFVDRPALARMAPYHEPPVYGRIYTIRDILPPFESDSHDEPGVRVEEIVNMLHPKWGIEFCYGIGMWRPAVDRGTDTGMSILRKIAKGDLVPA